MLTLFTVQIGIIISPTPPFIRSTEIPNLQLENTMKHTKHMKNEEVPINSLPIGDLGMC
ncbi:MAG: hypothetical protein JETT_1884 [Candidatus Jettenia ecosi]|uniref:Uncharacterized protein n=1 Tax=Candidatus Jettenia ecosi TaxID=2494326 RepID=A0A533QAX8_9BACT|nr:MAG: hypothetical protein JETT_1884 [Candidatus Jettenia ecosi]